MSTRKDAAEVSRSGWIFNSQSAKCQTAVTIITMPTGVVKRDPSSLNIFRIGYDFITEFNKVGTASKVRNCAEILSFVFSKFVTKMA